MSARTGAGLDELRAALGAGRRRRASAREPTGRRGSTSTASSRCRGIGTVVTGTLWSGTIGTGRQLRLEPSGRDVRVRSVQVHDAAVERARARASGSRSACPGVERRERPPGRRARRAGRVPDLVPARRRARGARADRGRRARLRASRHGRIAGAGRARRRALRAAAARGARRRGARRPRRPARRDDARRRHRARPRAAAASRRRRAARAARAGRSSPRRSDAPVRVDALRVRPRRRARRGRACGSVGWLLGGVARRLRATSCASGSRAPTRSIRAFRCPAEPWAPTSSPLLPVERRGSKLVPARARPRRSRARRRGGGARARARERRRPRGEGRRRRARALPRGERAARAARRRLRVGSARSSVARTSSSRSAAPQARSRSARFRDLVGAGVATRSSCSSDSTRTASRGASASRVLRRCGGQLSGERSVCRDRPAAARPLSRPPLRVDPRHARLTLSATSIA